ncbi:OLC1v1029257C1 [Oldenlandia corymbosa var. corymbosa]|uniref:OLC1v1029257C1 n=1 Tax=Oldenlandia corymbosa var. corymbosa TaxID=529605 RepID=A0AAV1CF73_OLDCO|nr:OLC1v1029257C1 [Oldenlandia corymbosa var. corymbosa]
MGMGTSRSNDEAGTSRDGSLFQNPANEDCMEDHSDPGYEYPANEDYMYYTDPNDLDYTLESGESEEGRSVSSESDNNGYESEEFEEEEVLTSVPGQRKYSEMGKWDPSSIDRDEFSLPKWDGTPDSIKLGTCFKNKKEMRASLKDHELWEMVKWSNVHNCLNATKKNNHRNVSASFIAQLIRYKVKVDTDYSVASVQVHVKEMLDVDVYYKRVWGGRQKTTELVYGDWVSNFVYFLRYFAALVKSNPGIVVEQDIDELFCLQHIRNNLVATFKSKRIRRLSWEMSEKLSLRKFKEHKQESRQFNVKAHRYIQEIDLCQWTLVKDGYHRWGNLTTNIYESYNNVLKGVHFLPIRALVEATFHKIVLLFLEEYEASLKCITLVSTELWEDFVKYEKRATSHKVDSYPNTKFKVTTKMRLGGKGGNMQTVRYQQKKCSCKKWQEYRMPCSHALAVCRDIGDQPINLVDPHYRTVA